MKKLSIVDTLLWFKYLTTFLDHKLANEELDWARKLSANRRRLEIETAMGELCFLVLFLVLLVAGIVTLLVRI